MNPISMNAIQNIINEQITKTNQESLNEQFFIDPKIEQNILEKQAKD